MKKNFKYFGITWIVGFILFNAITFIIPNEIFGVTRFDKGVFWIAYGLITLSFIAQLITAYKFVKDNSNDKTFLNIPLLRTGYIAIIVSIIVGISFMIFPMLPAWIGAIVCLLITGYFVIACVKASAVANIVADIDTKVKTKTAFMRMAIVEAENILARATTNEIKAEVKKVYEALKYSDPMSNSALDDIEQEINNGLKELKKAVTCNDSATVLSIVADLLLNVKERNSKCKELK
ncbi:MAG: hypothetical protein E7382_00700 [Clostridiales bacterium]|nr:hypothetical protein [Clostridiales bacterium]